jgi:hypothetical protein
MISRQVTEFFAVIVFVALVTGIVYSYNERERECQITVNAPDLFQPNQLIEVDASGSTGTLTWAISPRANNFKIIGKRVVFTGDLGVNEYTITVNSRRGDKSVQRTITIKLGYDSKIPMSKFQLEIISHLPAARTQQEVLALAQSFNHIARIVESKILVEQGQIIEATAWSVSDALGPGLDKWKPFLKKLQAYLDESPPADVAATWREIARALEASDGAA